MTIVLGDYFQILKMFLLRSAGPLMSAAIARCPLGRGLFLANCVSALQVVLLRCRDHRWAIQCFLRPSAAVLV